MKKKYPFDTLILIAINSILLLAILLNSLFAPPHLLAFMTKVSASSLFYDHDQVQNLTKGTNFSVEVYYDNTELEAGRTRIMIRFEPLNKDVYFRTIAAIDISELKEVGVSTGFINSIRSFNLTGDLELVAQYEDVKYLDESLKPYHACSWMNDLASDNLNIEPQEITKAISAWVNKEQWLRISYEKDYKTCHEFYRVKLLPLNQHA